MMRLQNSWVRTISIRDATICQDNGPCIHPRRAVVSFRPLSTCCWRRAGVRVGVSHVCVGIRIGGSDRSDRRGGDSDLAGPPHIRPHDSARSESLEVNHAGAAAARI